MYSFGVHPHVPVEFSPIDGACAPPAVLPDVYGVVDGIEGRSVDRHVGRTDDPRLQQIVLVSPRPVIGESADAFEIAGPDRHDSP